MSTIPETMHALVMTGVNTLSDETLPVPRPGPGEVLIRVHYSGINPVDYKNLMGLVPVAPTPLPASLGCDLSGVVVKLGAGVTDFCVGDEVYGMTGGLCRGPSGTLAEYAIAYAPMILPKPAGLSMREAAALPLCLLTGWEGIMGRCPLKAGQTVLITGGTGGVGHLLVQVAVTQGARVFATGSERKRSIIESHGGTFIDYQGMDVEAVRRLTPNGMGFDVIYDTFGFDVLSQMMQLISPLGRICTCSGFGSYDTTSIALKGCSLEFIFVGIPFTEHPPNDGMLRYYHGMFAAANALVADGKVRPLVDDAVIQLSKTEVLKAYDSLKAGQIHGKAVVKVLSQ